MIKLDGSHNEGGGQIVRTALALSMITQQPFVIENIRQGRSKPGLKAQHLTCVNSLIKLTNNKAKVIGNELGSERLMFCPAKIVKSKLDIDIGTAGSIILLLQCLLPPLVFRERRTTLNIIGGTDTKWSPTFDYLKEVIIPQLSKFAKIELNLLKRGFYPKGQGEVEVKINPNKLDNSSTINLNYEVELVFVSGKSFASKDLMDAQVAERQATGAEQYLKQYLNFQHVKINSEYNDALSTGSGITLWAILGKKNMLTNETDQEFSQIPLRIGSDMLGERGKKAEVIGKEAAEKLINEIHENVLVDVNLADNLIPYLGIVGGEFKTSVISNHTLTNIYTTEFFIKKKFKINKIEKIISI